MKKLVCLMLAVCLVFALTACGGSESNYTPVPTAAPEAQETHAPSKEASLWPRTGYFTDRDSNMLSIAWLDDTDEPGWYVGCLLGREEAENAWSGMLSLKDNSLRGTLPSFGEKEDLTVTITEEGTDGLLLTVEGGEAYHFVPYRMADEIILVTFTVDGQGSIYSAPGDQSPEFDPDYSCQSAQFSLAIPETYTLAARPDAGSRFVKWTKNGEDFSTDTQITLQLAENAEYAAVFEEDPDWRNPVLDYAGKYKCGKTTAQVESSGSDAAQIFIERSSGRKTVCWSITGSLDTDTMTIRYSGCTKANVVYDDKGEIQSADPEYENGTGTIVFGDGAFTWHEDQSESGEELVFQRVSEGD
ncbi:MAG: hypothetical protein J5633_07040 [Oscillospiraceae bacterium]|nr:hypothetical protein [Oscillospiraceae bacterium]